MDTHFSLELCSKNILEEQLLERTGGHTLNRGLYAWPSTSNVYSARIMARLCCSAITAQLCYESQHISTILPFIANDHLANIHVLQELEVVGYGFVRWKATSNILHPSSVLAARMKEWSMLPAAFSKRGIRGLRKNRGALFSGCT